jgi:putative transposase
MRAYKFRLYPNKEQEDCLTSVLTTCRHTYNQALADRIAAYKEEGRSLSYIDQIKALTSTKNEYQQQVYTQVLQNAIHRIDKTFKNFFEGRKAGRKAGFPRFKPWQRYNSFCYPQLGFKLVNGNSAISLSKIGTIKVRCHREPEGRIKTCTVVREIDQWYVVLTAETELAHMACEFPDEVIGVDVGIEKFATLSNGEMIPNPRHTKRSEARLARLQRRMARKKKGSRNRNKARIAVAKCHRRIARQRNDFLHKVSRKLANTYGTIVFEKLNIKGMVRNHCLAKHISDAAWNRLALFTSYKVESTGGKVISVDPRGTSQVCSGCGAIVLKVLGVRVHRCPHCGLVIDRDENASINIQTAGTAVSARGGRVSLLSGRGISPSLEAVTDEAGSLHPCGGW